MKSIIVLFMILGVALANDTRACEGSILPTPPDNLWKGLIAEASNQGYIGMYAVACCVRNRLAKGMNTGLCGLKRKKLDDFVKKEGKEREKQAKEIIKKVFEQNSPDITKGADHFESIRYKRPSWSYDMQRTCQIGEHIFYRSKK